MVDDISIHRSKLETARLANIWFALAIFASLVAFGGNSAVVVALEGTVVVGAFLGTLLLVHHRRRPAIVASLCLIQLVLLAAPWFAGGFRQPLSYLEIPFLLLSGFLVGTRIALRIALSFCLNVAVLVWAERHGWIATRSPSALAHLSMLAEASLIGLVFVARPLALTHRLLERSRVDNAQRLEHQRQLREIKLTLDERIREREKELLALQNRLRHVSETLSSSYSPIVQRIALRARFLQDTFKDRDETVQFPIQRIAAACERLTTMHEALSRFARLGPQGIQPAVLDAEAVRSMVRSLWEEIRIRYPRAGHRLFLSEFRGCRADPDLLRQIWQHLLSNAAKFSARQPKPRIVVGWSDGEFFINDNGCGFDSGNARNLFELFNRQHPVGEYPGDGIGLASAKRIAELHQGDLRIESESGKGTTAYLRLG
jgi:signal transduction histidine kinase